MSLAPSQEKSRDTAKLHAKLAATVDNFDRSMQAVFYKLNARRVATPKK